MRYSYLTEWVGRRGVKVDRKLARENTYVATYVKPEAIPFSFGEKTLTLSSKFKASESLYRTTLAEEVGIVLEPLGDIARDELGQEYVRIFQNLISFATDRPNAIEEIIYRAETDERGFMPKLSLILDRIIQLDVREKSPRPIDMIFCFEDAQTAGIVIFRKWHEFSNNHRAFCEVYFSHLYAGSKYLNDRFAKVLASFTMLCSTLGGASEKTKLFLNDVGAAMKLHFHEGDREFLENSIPTWAEVEMPLLLLGLLRENSDTMGQVIEDFPTFARSVSGTRAFIDRRVEGGRPPLQGDDLHYAVEKIAMLIKIIVLKELGFSGDDVKRLADRNQRFTHLKTI